MKVEDIKKIRIIGAGVMGPGIAEIFAIFGASYDFNIIIYDISKEALAKCETTLSEDFKRVASTGLYSKEDLKAARERIQLKHDISVVSDAQLIIEAVPEDLDLKKRVFKEIALLTSETTILATNSSGLSITDLSKGIENPGRVIGTHFMNPPLLMPLVEVVRGVNTSDEIINTMITLLNNVNKKPVLVKKDIPGYVHNRLQAALFRELMYLIDNNAMSVQDLELTVRYGLGLRLPVMRVFEMVDLMGIDTIHKVLSYLFTELNRDTKPPGFLEEMIQKNELGVKTGRGFHDYTNIDTHNSMQEKLTATFQLLMLMQQYD